jgi:hypothetical protein
MTVYALIFSLFIGSLVFASDYLLTEDGQTLTTESGDKLLLGNGKELDLQAFVKSKGGRLEVTVHGQEAKIKLPNHGDILLAQKSPNVWAPVSVAPTNRMFDVWAIKVEISKSLPDAEVSLEGSGLTFLTDSHGSGRSLFYVDAAPQKHMLTVAPMGEHALTANISLRSAATARCTGKSSLRCNVDNSQ